MDASPSILWMTDTWAVLFARASLQAFAVLAFVTVFCLAFRRSMSPSFAHGLFLLVPLRFLAVLACGLIAVEWPVDVPLPFVTDTTAANPANSADDGPLISTMTCDAEAIADAPGLPVKVEIEPESQVIRIATEFVDAGSSTPPEPAGHGPGVRMARSVSASWAGSAWSFLAWAACVSILVTRFVVLTLTMRRVSNRASLPVSDRLAATVSELSRDLGLRRSPLAVTTAVVNSPAVFGLIRPKLLIPEGFEKAFDEFEIRWAIAHELAHLKRRDLWAVAFERMVGLVGFFHPALWIARRATVNFRELACDEIACRVTGMPPRTCAETFLRILVWADSRPEIARNSPLALGLNPGFPAIRRRIENMTDPLISKRPARLGRISVAVLALMTMTISLPIVPNLVAMGPGRPQRVEGDPVSGNAQENPADQKATAGNSTRLRLIDTVTGEPVKDVQVIYVIDQASEATVRTDASGIAVIPFDAGEMRRLRYTTSRDGYVDSTESWSRDQAFEFPPPQRIERRIKPGVTVGGKIVDTKGRPIEGAEVSVTYSVNSIDRNGEPRVVNQSLVTRTDATGSFTSDRFDPGAINARVYVSHPGYVRAEREVPSVHEADWLPDLLARRYTLKMHPGKSMHGIVIGPVGEPVEGATVWNDEGSEYFEKTDERSGADGAFKAGNFGQLYPDGFRIAVHKPGIGWAIERITEAETDTPKTFRLVPSRSLSVTVRNADDGKPLAGARVLTSFVADSMWKDPARLTGPDGRYTTEDLPAAEIRISAHLEGFETRHIQVDTLSKDSVEIMLKRGRSIEGIVTDATNGQPIERYGVEQIHDTKSYPRTIELKSEKSANKFRISRFTHFADESKNSRIRLRFDAEGYEPFDTDFISVDVPSAPLKIALKPLGPERYVSGRVLRPDGTAAAGAALGYFSSPDFVEPRFLPALSEGQVIGMQVMELGRSGMRPRSLARTGADGTFRFPLLIPSMGWVVTHESGVFRSRSIVAKPAAPVELKLEPWSRVEGQFILDGKPAADALVRIDYPFEERRQPFMPIPGVNLDRPVRTDAEGRFRFDHVLPGPFRLSYAEAGTALPSNRVAGVFETKAGETLRIETRKSEFHFEEVAFAPDGKQVARSEFGSDRPGFRIYGNITDEDTGEPVRGTWSYAFSGYDLNPDIWVAPATSESGKFETQAISPVPPGMKPESIDPWLIVVANGYEPYVSPERIRNESKPVRRDVKLKPIDKSKWHVYSGRLVRADGTSAGRVRIDFTFADPGIGIGKARFRWVLKSNIAFMTNVDGSFEFAMPRKLDRLIFSDGVGVAVVRADDFASGDNPVAKLGEFARIEGRFTQGGKPLERLGLRVDQGLIPNSLTFSFSTPEIRDDGTFTISKVPPIPAKITFNDARDLRNVMRLESVDVEPRPGETTRLDIDLEAAEPARNPKERPAAAASPPPK